MILKVIELEREPTGEPHTSRVSAVSASAVQTRRQESHMAWQNSRIFLALSPQGQVSQMENLTRQAGGHWFEPSTAHIDPLGHAAIAWLSSSKSADRAECAMWCRTGAGPSFRQRWQRPTRPWPLRASLVDGCWWKRLLPRRRRRPGDFAVVLHSDGHRQCGLPGGKRDDARPTREPLRKQR